MTNASKFSAPNALRLATLLMSISLFLLFMSAWHSSAWGDTRVQEPRIGLIIANFDYPGVKDKLSGPRNDADLLAKALTERGFVGIEGDVGPTVRKNLGLQQTKNLINAFKRSVETAGPTAVGFIYYAGHGAADSAGTDNFLLPTDIADIESADISKQGLGVRWITTQLRGIDSHPKLIIVVDACRTTNSQASKQYLRAPDLQQPSGMLVALSTGENQVANDNGMYAQILAKKINTQGLNIVELFEQVKLDMARKTGNTQIPVYQSQILEPLCLAGCTVVVQPRSDPMVSLKMAMELRPTGDTGQVAAMEQMTSDGKSFAGLDLRGVYLSGARLGGANFKGADLEVTDLAGSILIKAILSKAFFSFSRMNNVKAMGADATETLFYFAQAEAGDFSELQGRQSNWQAASLRGSSFRNANLQGASFQMADLRDTDFTGADLRGTFFMGSLIAGARFDGAKIDNTDFSGAIGNANQFTSAQQAGLCGTDADREQGYKYTLRTFAKSAPIGDRYHDFFSDWAPLRSGWRYLEPCTPRTLAAAGKAPIWQGRDHEMLIEELTLEFPPELTDAADREDRIKQSAEKALTTLKEETKAGGTVTVSGKRSRALLEALEHSLASGQLLSEPILDTDATFLYQVLFQQQTISDSEWEERAREWVNREDREKDDAGYSGTMRWARFFPPSTRSTELSDADVSQFKRWTIKRAQQFPKLIALELYSQSVVSAMANMQNEEYDITHTPFLTVLPVRDYAKENPVSVTPEEKVLLTDLSNMFSARGVAIHLQSSPDSYILQLPRSKAPLIRQAPPLARALLEVNGIQVLSRATRKWVVLEGDLSELHVQLSDGTVISATK
jgi:uncharacterized protein YjbI with pentapeptide repeats